MTTYTYTFHNHFHPFVGELLGKLNKDSIDGLLDPDFHESDALNQEFFEEEYSPNTDEVSVISSPKTIDIELESAYSIYNWELLFHIPLSIAVHLSKNQRFAEAQKWFHYIFDPTAQDGQFWRFIAFRGKRFRQIDELLRLLSKPDDELDTTEEDLKQVVLRSYESLRKNPFQPHVVARSRPIAYQYCVCMKYLDNLIAWGDSLFRLDTIEALNEATQIFVLAANLLGPRPQFVPQTGTIKPKTFAQLREGLDPLGNALIEMEGQFPFKIASPTTGGVDTDRTRTLFGIVNTLYFCIPRNEKLLGYWDIVADRLFKIRHCMNIHGLVRQLPLFQPPIDPGMLVKAAAGGIDVSSLVSGLNQPLAPVRSMVLLQKAKECCNEVRSLGNALLSVLEKQDGEALGLLRQRHEIHIQQLAQDVRYLQWKEAESSTESLLKSRESALERYRFYQRLLGATEEDFQDISEINLERQELTEENFDEIYGELVGQYEQDIASKEYPSLEIIDEGKLYLNRNENEELNVQMPKSQRAQDDANTIDTSTSALYLIPGLTLNAKFWGIGADSEVSGGQILGKSSEMVTSWFRGVASRYSHSANVAAKTASYERRADDWRLQSNLAAKELVQIGRQIISSLIREQITRLEYENLKQQIRQAQEIDQFLHSKFTNEELYSWMQGELSKLFYECYKFAQDVCLKTEQTIKHELMRPELDELKFIKFNYYDTGRKGLLSGEALCCDLNRLEMAYHDYNKREYELTKHISLRRLDPIALLSLKTTGSCEVNLPEWLFDLDTPGLYMRRIKNVSLSIPAVTGPYTSVNCTLSLLKSSLRKSPALLDGEYQRSEDNDPRFVDYYGTIQSVVTSSAQNDSGMFETNLRDERFLPFECQGVVSTWRLELPAEFRQFDYNTATDVILHLRYTARQGGGLLKEGAVASLRELLSHVEKTEQFQLFSLKHDFPSEWHRLTSEEPNSEANIQIQKEYFPYIVQDRDVDIHKVELINTIRGEVPQPKTVIENTPGGGENTLSHEFNTDKKIVLPVSSDQIGSNEVFMMIKYSINK